MNIRKMTTCAVGIALTVVAIMVLRVPSFAGNGYYHLGEIVMMTVAIVYGARTGMVVGGVGAALADMLAGYIIWAPFSLVIHGAKGWVIGTVVDKAPMNRWVWLLATLLGALLMVVCYATVETKMYGWAAAVADIPGNCLQALAGIIGSMLLSNLLLKRKSKVGS